MNHRESMEEDDMVKSRVGNTLVQRRNDEEDKRAVSPRGLIRRCQKYYHKNSYFYHLLPLNRGVSINR